MHKLDLNTAATPTPATPAESDQVQPAVDEISTDRNNANSMKSSPKIAVFISVVAILAGAATGYGGYKLRAQSEGTGGGKGASISTTPGASVQKGDVFGVNDAETFKDSAEGYLEAGGLDGEGSHQLLRPGGESQTVYLTSSVTDLDKLVGMEVKVSGETFKGQKAGWLMDVGRVEVVNPKGQAPIEE